MQRFVIGACIIRTAIPFCTYLVVASFITSYHKDESFGRACVIHHVLLVGRWVGGVGVVEGGWPCYYVTYVPFSLVHTGPARDILPPAGAAAYRYIPGSSLINTLR